MTDCCVVPGDMLICPGRCTPMLWSTFASACKGAKVDQGIIARIVGTGDIILVLCIYSKLPDGQLPIKVMTLGYVGWLTLTAEELASIPRVSRANI